MRFVDAEVVMKAVGAFETVPIKITGPQLEAIATLENATVYEIDTPMSEAESPNTAKAQPLGDESMPPQVRLEARLAAACRLIDNLDKFSIYSIRFVSEQRRFLQELKDSRGAMGRAHRGETGI